MKDNQKIFYLKIFLIFAVLALVSGLFFEISFGNPQKSKWLYIFQKYHLKRELNWQKNYSGVWNEWDEDGELMVSTQVKDGVMDGEQLIWYDWHDSPNILHKKHLYKNGELQQTNFYNKRDGEINFLTKWKDGKTIELEIRYYSHDKTEYIRKYKNDTSESAFVGFFYVDGSIIMEGNLKNYQPIGEWSFWDKNGKLIRKLHCDDYAQKRQILDRYYEFTAEFP